MRLEEGELVCCGHRAVLSVITKACHQGLLLRFVLCFGMQRRERTGSLLLRVDYRQHQSLSDE
jgi:hypothetical protein